VIQQLHDQFKIARANSLSSENNCVALEEENYVLAKHAVRAIARNRQHRGWHLGIALALGMSGAIAFSGKPATSQITPDATLGTQGSVVTPNVNIRGLPADQIDGGVIRGVNLFHSFQDFNVGNGQRVYFANPTGIENILSRITGSNPSNILGTLGVNGAASLFLLNPNGIIFGQNAKLDIAGSLLATTANSLVFSNGSEFSAKNPQAPPLLTINVRPGLQYGLNASGSITNSGNLAVGQDLTLAAGNLDLQGQLHAGGNLALQAFNTLRIRDSLTNPFIAAAQGQLLVQGNQAVDIFALNHPASGFFSGGDTVLRSANTVGSDAHYTTSGNFRIEQLNGSPGNLFSPYDPVILAFGDVLLGDYTGGSLHILAGGSVTLGNVVIIGTDAAVNTISPLNPIPYFANLANVTLSDGTPLVINGAAQTTLDVRAGINWAALGGFPGNTIQGIIIPPPPFIPTATSANITIGSINNDFLNSVVFLTNQYSPNTALPPGSITTTGLVSAFGLVAMDARNSVRVARGIDVSINAGNAGDIKLLGGLGGIDTRGGVLTTASDNGNGGDIILTATGNILTSGLGTFVGTGGTGNGGNITLTSGAGFIDTTAGNIFSSTPNGNGGTVSFTAFGNIFPGNVSSSNAGLGKAGAINLTSIAGDIVIAGSLIETTTSGLGAGDINVRAKLVSLTDIAELATNTYGLGDSGNVNIQAQSLFVTGGSEVLAQTFGSGRAGNILVNATDSVTLSGVAPFPLLTDGRPGGFSSGLFSTTEEGATGQGGAIAINTPALRIENGAVLSARTRSTAKGGDVLVNVNTLDITRGGQILTSAFSSGSAGGITLNATGDVRISGRDPSFFDRFNQLQSIFISSGQTPEQAFKNTQAVIDPVGPSSGLEASDINGIGTAGDITINARSLSLSDVALIDTTTRGSGKGGDVRIQTQSLSLIGGAEVLAQTFGSGKAGDIIITSGWVTLSGVAPFPALEGDLPGGFSSGLFVTTEKEARGEGGDIRLTTGVLSIEKGAVLSARSRGVARGGDITINANTVDIKDGGQILTTAYSSGSAGGITINATGNITISGSDPTYRDRFDAVAAKFGQEQAEFTIDPTSPVSALQAQSLKNIGTGSGDIRITADSLLVSDNAELSTSTAGRGNAGLISVVANGWVALDNARVFSTVERGALANGGGITIQAGLLSLVNGAQLQTLVRGASETSPGGRGNAGNVAIAIRDAIRIDGVSDEGLPSQITSKVQSGAIGNGGRIDIQAGSLALTNGAQLNASTLGQGTAGNIKIDVGGDVTLSGLAPLSVCATNAVCNSQILSEVGSGAVGNGGRIDLRARSLLMRDRSTLGVGTFGVGDAGNISVQVDDLVSLSQVSSIRSIVEQGGIGRGGKVDIRARSLTLTEGGQIGTVIFRKEGNQPGGRGQGGDITINASDSVIISGIGEDRLNPGERFSSGVLASTEDGAIGPGGNITINTNNLSITDDGIVTSKTRNSSDAGSIFLNVNDKLTVENNGTVSVNGEGAGNPGNIRIAAGSVFLNQGGKIQATSASGRNANIVLRVDDSIEMRFNSEISAEAFNNGDGGNIVIRAGNNIFGILPENSDIVANAFDGKGGNVFATAQLVRGFRQAGKVRSPESDFIASSVFGVNGTEKIESQDRLEEALPANIVDPVGLIDRRCSVARGPNTSSFTITGRGGLPPNPGDPLQNDAVMSNWVSLDSEAEKKPTQGAVAPTPTKPNRIVEAQGWVIDSNGKVVLTAQAPTVTPKANWHSPAGCNTPQASTVQPVVYR
jgi:filamentous hemagglutinin family protein